MNRWSMFFIAAVVLSAFLVNIAYAESMRCGSHIISTGGLHGPDRYEILKKCGEPTVRRGNTWVYERSGGKAYVVVFDYNGDLMRIEYSSS